MENNKVILTREGYEKLKAELQDLIDNKRPDASAKIAAAREYGDLSENAEYDAAKEEQAQIEYQIKNIQNQLDNCTIIESEDVDDNVVSFGSYVKIYDCEYDEVIVYQIVGSTESDISQNKISNEAPLSKALLGKKKGQKATVTTPQCSFDVKIMAVSKEKIEI